MTIQGHSRKPLDKCTGNRYNYGSNYYLCGFYKI